MLHGRKAYRSVRLVIFFVHCGGSCGGWFRHFSHNNKMSLKRIRFKWFFVVELLVFSRENFEDLLVFY